MSEQIPVKDVTPGKVETYDLYAKREKIQTRSYEGFFKNVRLAGVAFLFMLYFGTAWLQWGGRQAVLFDLPARQFHIFGATFQPQDFFLLSFLLIICAFGLFFITVFAGRVWCGYTCPQTVWTWIFMWAERVTEGERNARIKLDKAPMSANKLARRTAKHSIWLGVSLITALTFVGYFTPIRGLIADMFTFEMAGWALFWVFFFTAATYINAGWLREQVCTHMCPYARFQSVMFDKDTLIISYDEERGEPRGSRKRTEDHKAKGLGDCIDCQLCVQVCPTGIDIRDGLQYECIACAACIDVCDQVMDKMGYDRGLVRYTTENAMQGVSTHVVRPRTIMYTILLGLLSIGLVYAITQRTPLELDIIRDRNSLYRETADGLVENVYTLKIINMDKQDHRYRLTVSGVEGLQLVMKDPVVTVAAGEVLGLPVSVRVDPVVLDRAASEIKFSLVAESDPDLSRTEKARFLGPVLR